MEINNCEYKGYDIQDLDLEKDKLPDNEGSIDIIVSLGLIEALKNPSHLIKESQRVLKKVDICILLLQIGKKIIKIFLIIIIIKLHLHQSLESALRLNYFKI